MYVEGEGVPVGLARLIASLRPIGPLDKYRNASQLKKVAVTAMNIASTFLCATHFVGDSLPWSGFDPVDLSTVVVATTTCLNYLSYYL